MFLGLSLHSNNVGYHPVRVSIITSRFLLGYVCNNEYIMYVCMYILNITCSDCYSQNNNVEMAEL